MSLHFLNFPRLVSKACRTHKTILITLPCTLARKEPPNCLDSRKRPGGFPGGSVVKKPPANSGDTGLIPDPEVPTGRRATKPACHNYWAGALEPGTSTSEAGATSSLRSAMREAIAMRRLSTGTREKPVQQWRPGRAKRKYIKKFFLKKKKKKTWDFTAGFLSSTHEGAGSRMTPGPLSRWGSGLLIIYFSPLPFPSTPHSAGPRECLMDELNSYQSDADAGCPQRPQASAVMSDAVGFDH